jgi:hypothetical protein
MRLPEALGHHSKADKCAALTAFAEVTGVAGLQTPELPKSLFSKMIGIINLH